MSGVDNFDTRTMLDRPFGYGGYGFDPRLLLINFGFSLDTQQCDVLKDRFGPPVKFLPFEGWFE